MKGEKVVAQRILKDFIWQVTSKRRVICRNKKSKGYFAFDITRYISFLKFAPSVLNKMRIEISKELRLNLRGKIQDIRLLRQDIKKLKKEIRELKKEVRVTKKQRPVQQSVFARARKVKSEKSDNN